MKTLKNAYKLVVVMILEILSMEGWGQCDLRGRILDVRCKKSGTGPLTDNQKIVLEAWKKVEPIYPKGPNAKEIFGELFETNVEQNIKVTEIWRRTVPTN